MGARATSSSIPVWLIAGFLVPLTLLPGWVRPISWLLAPTWGVDAIREAAQGGGAWPEIAALPSRSGACYLAIGIAVLETVLASARRRREPRTARDVGADLLRRRADQLPRAVLLAAARGSYIPSFLVGPIAQILLFAYIGRTAGSSRTSSS